MKGSYTIIKCDLSQGKSTYMIHHINDLSKNNVLISTDAGKAFEKTQRRFMIKVLNKVGTEATYIILIMAIYDKPTGNIILNSEKLKAFSSKIRKREGCLHLPILST